MVLLLKAFVQDAIEFSAIAGFSPLMADILQTNDTWRQDDIYLFVLLVAQERTAMLFHGVDLSQMDQRVWELEDVNGVKFIQEMIRVGGEGGGFVEYYFDNPAIEGDEETGSYTLSYVELYSAPDFLGGQPFLFGANFYPPSPGTDSAGDPE